MKPHRIKNECPVCFYEVDAASNLAGDTSPAQGDYSLCINCASLLRFNDHLTLEVMQEDEVRELESEDPELCRIILTAQSFLKEMLKHKPHEPTLPGPDKKTR